MNIDELIAKAIAESHPHDLSAIRQYIAWVKIRRQIHDAFYKPVHWMKSHTFPALPVTVERRRPMRQKFPSAHWMGR